MIKHSGIESVVHVMALEAVAMSGYPRIKILQNAETIMAFEAEYMTVFSLTVDSLISLLISYSRPYMTVFPQFLTLIIHNSR
jgi:hypothetical protein